MDAAEGSIDSDVLIPHLLRDLLRHCAHLDGCPPVDLQLHLLPQLVLVQQLAEVAAVLGLRGAILPRLLLLFLLVLVLEVFLVFLLFMRPLLIDGRLGVVFLVVVAASRFLAIHHHHLVVGGHCAIAVAVSLLLAAEFLAKDMVQGLLVDLRRDAL